MRLRKVLFALVFLGIGLGIGYYSGRHSTASDSKASNTPTAKNTLGPWQAKFTVPGSADLPQQTPFMKCSFSKVSKYDPFLNVTLTNLNDRSYVVRYAILGYDKKGRRISKGTDEFVIGRRESVVRNVFVESQAPLLPELGSVFWIQMFLEE